MAWYDVDPFAEEGPEEDSQSSPRKAEIAVKLIKSKRAAPGSPDAGYKGSFEESTDRRYASEEIDKRRVLLKIRKMLGPKANNEDAAKILEAMGGIRAYLSGRVMADEDKVREQDMTLRELVNRARGIKPKPKPEDDLEYQLDHAE